MKQTNKEKLFEVLDGNIPIIGIETKDEQSVYAALKEYVENQGEEYDFYSWDEFFKGTDEKTHEKVIKEGKEENPRQEFDDFVQDNFLNTNKNTILLVKVDPFREGKRFEIYGKNFIHETLFPFASRYDLPQYKEKEKYKKHLIFIDNGARGYPSSIFHLLHLMKWDYPSFEEIKQLVTEFAKENNITLLAQEIEHIANAAKGLSEIECIQIIHYLYHKKQTVDAKEIHEHKIEKMKQEGVLQYIQQEVSFSDMGGYENLKEWIQTRKLLLQEKVRNEYNLSFPKGVLLTGVQGCGKSMAAKGIATELDLPLFYFNMGKLFERYLGDSEKKLQKVLSLVETLSPCVLWIDEIEKFLSSNGSTHEVTKKIMGTFLTWLQEKDSPVFLVATANNIGHMPPELMRKGRFDEIFFVDLPTRTERLQIVDIHLQKHKIELSEKEKQDLATQMIGFSGAEMEQVIQEGIVYALFQNEEITKKSFIQEIQKTTPLSVLMKERIESIREWAKENKIRKSSKEEVEKEIHKKRIGFATKEITVQ